MVQEKGRGKKPSRLWHEGRRRGVKKKTEWTWLQHFTLDCSNLWSVIGRVFPECYATT